MKKEYLHKPFGNSDLDRLAQAIYNEFHQDEFDVEPWPLYTKQKHDMVVEEFRMAALAALGVVRASSKQVIYPWSA